MRRLLPTALLVTVVFALLLGIAYPLVIFGIGQAAFNDKANGSLVKDAHGTVTGSSLLGQEFLDSKGAPAVQYFQPRPSAAGTGYDGAASAASNLGPGDPRLVGFIPGLNIYDEKGQVISGKNPYATKEDPACVPTDAAGAPILVPSDGTPTKAADGSYVCLSSTVPERVMAYRQLNGLGPEVQVPVDAVTGSFSGLDPDISIANAQLQAARVARARHLTRQQVLDVVKSHTEERVLGVLGERTVNVLGVNLALDKLGR